jgi:hypothetical protein
MHIDDETRRNAELAWNHDGKALCAQLGIEDTPAYNDGSGKTSFELACAIRTLAEREDKLAATLAWIRKNVEILAGLTWRVGYLDPEIELGPRQYRGKRVTPAEVAKLWPDARWVRARKDYESEGVLHWDAVMDGITVRIPNAESIQPVKVRHPRVGSLAPI